MTVKEFKEKLDKAGFDIRIKIMEDNFYLISIDNKTPNKNGGIRYYGTFNIRAENLYEDDSINPDKNNMIQMYEALIELLKTPVEERGIGV